MSPPATTFNELHEDWRVCLGKTRHQLPDMMSKRYAVWMLFGEVGTHSFLPCGTTDHEHPDHSHHNCSCCVEYCFVPHIWHLEVYCRPKDCLSTFLLLVVNLYNNLECLTGKDCLTGITEYGIIYNIVELVWILGLGPIESRRKPIHQSIRLAEPFSRRLIG